MPEVITQQHAHGCGVACVAFATGKSYQEALIVLPADSAQARGFFCKDLVLALDVHGSVYVYKYLKPRLRRQIYNEGVIVYIKKFKHYPAGHYLIRSNGYWMDPWINFTQDKDIENAKSGYRIRLPGTPIYALFPT